MPSYYPGIYFDMDLYCWMWGIFIEGCEETPKISPIPSKEQAKLIIQGLERGDYDHMGCFGEQAE